jgi:hypothetical protein
MQYHNAGTAWPRSRDDVTTAGCPEIAWELIRLAYLFLPLLGGAIGVGLCNRFNWVSFLALPVDMGLTLRGRRLCGNNKTFRGFGAGAIGTATLMALQAKLFHHVPAVRTLEYVDYAMIHSWRFGFVLGLTRMLSELPNSFLKRQLDIPPGGLGTGVWLPVFYALDRLDYLPGTWIVFARLIEVNFSRVMLSSILVFLVHHLADFIGYCLGMKRSMH